MGDGRADAGHQEQPGAENAGGGLVCCHLTFQTLLQPVRMAHPENFLQPSQIDSAIFRMQLAEGCAVDTFECDGDFQSIVFSCPDSLEVLFTIKGHPRAFISLYGKLGYLGTY